MVNPVQLNQGYTFNSLSSGIIGTAAQSGTGTLAASTAVTALTFNPETTGPGSGAFNKGSFIELASDGHAPDIIASITSSSALALLTAASGSGSAIGIKAFNFPGLITGEASAIASTDTLLSSYFVGYAGVGGVVTQSDFSNAAYADIVFIAGAAFTPTAGGYIALWFEESEDTGTFFEKTVSNASVPRAPDCVIPLFVSAYAAGDRAWVKGIELPSCPFKVLFQNESGAAMPATWGIWMIPEGLQMTN
jgi:hypothetical protein